MISADNLSKSFGNQILFENVSFKINRKERVGLVGRNGHGKTTLFKMIAGLAEPDSGAISMPKNYRIGYVRQEIDFTAPTVLEEGMKGLPPDSASHSWKVEKILSGLGFSETDMNGSPLSISGGYQVRLNLAKVLLSEPDLLLLDEPTNYLDITSIRWIQNFLSAWPRELFLITHNRSFMDRLVTHVVGLYRRKTRKIAGNTEKYYMQIAQDEEIHEKTRVNEEKRKKEIEEFISRFRAKARLAGMVQSRIKTLNKLGRREKLDKFRSLDFSFRYKPFNGKYMLGAKHLHFGFEDHRPLISDFSITVAPNDRICVIGRNGAGKTTLLKLIAGNLPLRKGEISWHPEATVGYFEQTNVKSLVDSRTVEEEIRYSNPDIDYQNARNICGAMLFEGDAALKKIGVLSGGEKSRVMLGKILGTPVNLLLLDEPTNHFDMESCDAMLAAIDQFPGAVIMVTHNEMFLHALAERLIIFQKDGIEVFEGDYQRFLEVRGWEGEDRISAGRQPPLADVPDLQINKKELKRRRSALVAERSRMLKPLQQETERLESQIDDLDRELNRLQHEMQAAAEQQDGPRISELAQSIHGCQSKIDALFSRLEQASGQLSEKQAKFDRQLAEIDDLDAR